VHQDSFWQQHIVSYTGKDPILKYIIHNSFTTVSFNVQRMFFLNHIVSCPCNGNLFQKIEQQ